MTISNPIIDGYIRVSRKAGREGESYFTVDQQEAAIRRWIDSNGYALGRLVKEEDVSGKLKAEDRGLETLLRRAESGSSAGIVVQYQDRLTRGRLADAASIWERLEAAGARFVAVDDGVDSTAEGSELFFGIRAALSREQWKSYAKKWKLTKEDAIKKGFFIGATPTGYLREDKRLVPDPILAPVVKKLWPLRAEGASWGDLVRFFVANGGSPNTSRQTMQNMLRNRTYLGWSRSGEFVNTSAHEPLVSERLFDLVAEKQVPRNRTGRASAESLLGGLARCDQCGKAMQVTTNGRSKLLYKCVFTPCPARASCNAADLDTEVVERLKSYWATYKFAHVLREAGNEDQVQARIRDSRSRVADAEHVLRKWEENERDYLKALTPAEFAERLNKYRNELADARLDLEAAELEQSEPPTRVNVSDLWDAWSHEERKAWLRQSITEVRVRKAGGRPVPVADRMALELRDGLWLHPKAGWSSEPFGEPQSPLHFVSRSRAKKQKSVVT